MSPSQELVQIVDEHNRPCGATTRAYMRQMKLWHRASYIYVQRSDGCICVQKRTAIKDIYPSAFDLSAGGVVDAGEAMHVAAKRELAEELGITGVPLTFCFEQTYVDDTLRIHGGVFLVKYSGKLVLQESEVDSVQWIAPSEALALSPVTPDSHIALTRLLDEGWL